MFSKYLSDPNAGLCPVKSPTALNASAVTPAMRPAFKARSSRPVVMPVIAAEVMPATSGAMAAQAGTAAQIAPTAICTIVPRIGTERNSAPSVRSRNVPIKWKMLQRLRKQ
jgi:hypothetical protein